MPRIRTIKPEFWEHEQLGRLSCLARLTFIGLWSLSDDEGRGRADMEWLWGRMHSYQGGSVKARFRGAMKDLEATEDDKGPVVLFYEVCGARYYWLPGFSRQQRIDKPRKSKIPAHPDSQKILGLVQDDSRLYQGVDQGEDQGSGKGPPAEGGGSGTISELVGLWIREKSGATGSGLSEQKLSAAISRGRLTKEKFKVAVETYRADDVGMEIWKFIDLHWPEPKDADTGTGSRTHDSKRTEVERSESNKRGDQERKIFEEAERKFDALSEKKRRSLISAAISEFKKLPGTTRPPKDLIDEMARKQAILSLVKEQR